MASKKRFMEAVAEKVGKRAPVMKRKGMESPSASARKPGMAVMIAIGAPKPGPMGQGKMKREMAQEGMDEESTMSKADKIAALQEKIAYLKSQLALLEDEEDTSEDESEMKDEQEYEDEDED